MHISGMRHFIALSSSQTLDKYKEYLHFSFLFSKVVLIQPGSVQWLVLSGPGTYRPDPVASHVSSTYIYL